MPTELFNLGDFIPDVAMDELGSEGSNSGGTDGTDGVSWKEPEYEGTIDYRIRQLSYSSLLTLHDCPRKFQLYKLRTTHRSEEQLNSTITFAFGHVIGEAIQNILAGQTEEQIFFQMFLRWKPDLFVSDDKASKSFWNAVIAIQKFISMRQSGFLQEYDLVYYNGKPACELSFAINFPDGFRLRGYVDAVLVHRTTGKVIVLELKTTGLKVLNPATYKNSSQAIGYSVVLDVIFPDISSYEVLYLVYQTTNREYHTFPFVKTYLQRALWIQEVLLDIETIKMYEQAQVYPSRGESCYNFFRECEYFNSCTLSTEYLTKKCTAEEEDTIEYQINLSLTDLIETQLTKVQN
jgi:PD-(D/E)XK nuclease superfamily